MVDNIQAAIVDNLPNSDTTMYVWSVLNIKAHVTICDAIKQNDYESELKKNKKSVFISIVCHNNRVILCWKPQQDQTYDSRDIAISVMLKTMQYKGNWILLLALSVNQY